MLNVLIRLESLVFNLVELAMIRSEGKEGKGEKLDRVLLAATGPAD